MGIIYSKSKKSKPPNNAKTRQLAAEWEAMVKANSKPLERGAKAKGVDTKTVKPKSTPLQATTSARQISNEGLKIKSVKMTGAATINVSTKDMQEAVQRVSARVGQAYNKGGLQYLTDDELEEQKTGAHKRR